VPQHSAGASCLSAPRAAVLQEAGGPCYSLGIFSSRKVEETFRGINVEFSGGDKCSGNGVLRSTKIIVECADVAAPKIVRAGHGTSLCSYEVLVHARAGCALECGRNASGAICGGAAYGSCLAGGADGPARCKCNADRRGLACEEEVPLIAAANSNSQIGDAFSLYNSTVHSAIASFPSLAAFVISLVWTFSTFFRAAGTRRRRPLIVFILGGVLVWAATSSHEPLSRILQQSPPKLAAARSIDPAKKCEPPPPLFLIYSNRDIWTSFTVKTVIFMFDTLQTRYGWREYTPRERNPRENAVAMEENILREFGRAPDVFLILHYNVQEMPIVNRQQYPRILLNETIYISYFDDLPHNPGITFFSTGDKDWLSLADADLLLPTYEYLMVRAQAIAHVPRIWMPHSALPMYELPFNTAPRQIVLLVGHVDDITYPMRAAIQRRIDKGDSRFERFQDPGWQPGPSLSHIDSFAAALNANLAAIFCSNRHHYAVAKVMEVPATGALMLFTDDLSDALEALGFVDGVHWVSFNASSLDATVDWVLDPHNRARVDAVRAAGQALAHARHLTDARVDAIHAAALELARAKREGGKPNLGNVARFSNYANWTRKDPRSADYYAGRAEYPSPLRTI
jgi:hypothetical protein